MLVSPAVMSNLIGCDDACPRWCFIADTGRPQRLLMDIRARE